MAGPEPLCLTFCSAPNIVFICLSPAVSASRSFHASFQDQYTINSGQSNSCVVNLPFLKSRRPAKLRRQVGESRYGFSEGEEMQEQALEELMEAVQSKDHKKLMTALHALIDCIHAEESSEHAPDAQKDPGSV